MVGCVVDGGCRCRLPRSLAWMKWLVAPVSALSLMTDCEEFVGGADTVGERR